MKKILIGAFVIILFTVGLYVAFYFGENYIPKNCVRWFDGCHQCDAEFGCTTNLCFGPKKRSYCIKFKSDILDDKSTISNDLISYSTGNLFIVTKDTKTFSYTTDQLSGMANECGSQHEADYFNKLVAKFNSSTETVYNFKYTGDTQDNGVYTVTLIPNILGYTTLDQFKKDFDICAAGGDLYPTMLNAKWLLFVNACGTGFDDGSGRPHGCDEVRKVVEPSLKLNQ